MYELRGYFVTGNKSSRKSLIKNHRNLVGIIPTWLELKGDGSLLENQDNREVKLLNGLKNKNNIIPLVQNYQMKSKASNTIVINSNNRKAIKQKLHNYLMRTGYRNLNFDLEGIKKENKEELNNFIREISNYFHKNNYQLELSIPAKAGDNCSQWAGAYEYEKIGKLVDRIVIMAYYYHWVNGPAGAIAPLPWVQDVIDYAIMKILPEKIYLGIPGYGYDWIITDNSQSARGLSYFQIMQIKEKYNSKLEWDQESQTPYLRYENRSGQHEVWFENKESIIKKLDLVKEFQLRGAVLWRLGLEDPALWAELD
jgi:spore germination protein YaaH